MKKYLLFLFVFSSLFSEAQEFNSQRLLEIAEEQRTLFEERQDKIRRLAGPMGFPQRLELSNGNSAVLVDIQNDRPVYFTTYNQQARVTTGVDSVQSPSGLGLNLFGDGMKVAVFDGGAVLTTHAELQGRVLNNTDEGLDNHATHVTGTIAAKGINPTARGMMPNSEIVAYYALSGNDISPMAQEANAGTILSNHSYGPINGWNFSGGSWAWTGGANEVDPDFGLYTNRSRSIDDVAFNAPNYLVVWSAGNHRSDIGDGSRPPDGPYDCISPPGVAKNIMTVGAITGFNQYRGPEDAVMSNFSSWGPTNDGRIKPDIVGDGVSVLSTGVDSEDDYWTTQGTSMSAPNVTGSLGVLQQYYKELNGEFMRSATLKALAIHTAREAGPSPGPDYRFGWGVMNTLDAVKVLRDVNGADTVLVEDVLDNGQSKSYSFFSDGATKISATIAWTDRPGDALQEADADDTSPRLVNDLDIRLIDDEGNEVSPWILDPSQVGRAATKGDNFRDNVEKIEFELPEPRSYTLLVTHKNNLVGDSQAYSLVLTGNELSDNTEELYWIAGSGATNSETNWSDESGGTSIPMLDLSMKTLVFDGNSTITADDIITVSGNVTVNNLLWVNNNSATIDLNGNTLTVTNLLYSQHDSLTFKNGKVILGAANQQALSLLFKGSTDFELEMQNSSPLEITSAVELGSLSLAGSQVSINNSEVVLNNLVVDNGSVLDLKSSEISINEKLELISGSILDESSIWSFVDATISNQGELQELDSVMSSGVTTVSGLWFARTWEQQEELVIAGSLLADKYIMTSADLVFDDAGSISVIEDLQIDATADQRSSISSNGDLGQVIISYRDLLCFDFVDLNNVEFVTESVVNFGPASSLTDVVNAVNLNCDDVVFASFSVTGECANSPLNITNLSKGAIEQYLYDFGNGDSSSLEEPILVFDEPGTYSVEQRVSNALIEESFSLDVTVVENPLAPISIIENDESLIASLVSDNYTWYYNGVEIDDFNERTLTPEEEGFYRVAYERSGEECLIRVSEPYNFLVTALEDEVQDVAEKEFRMYPNPTADYLYVQDSNPLSDVLVYSLDGKLVPVRVDKEARGVRLDVAELEKGMYIMSIATPNRIITKRFIKE